MRTSLESARAFVLLVFMVLSADCFCHDQNLVTLQIRHVNPDLWTYEVMTPLANLDASLRASIPGLPEGDSDTTAYKEQLVAYIKQGFNVTATGYDANQLEKNAVALSLGRGRMQLGDHVSTLIFTIKGMPKKVTKLDYRLTNMSENAASNKLFRVIDGQQSQHFILNNGNDYSVVVSDFFAE